MCGTEAGSKDPDEWFDPTGGFSLYLFVFFYSKLIRNLRFSGSDQRHGIHSAIGQFYPLIRFQDIFNFVKDMGNRINLAFKCLYACRNFFLICEKKFVFLQRRFGCCVTLLRGHGSAD